MQGYANWGGLVQELGFIFVTQFMSLEPSKVITQKMVKNGAPFTASFLFSKLLYFA